VAHSAAVAQDLSSLYPEHPEELFKPIYQEYKLEGHVILYARSWPGWPPNQEFVLKTSSPKMPLIRIVYLPACCFDSPSVPPEEIFDERQFATPASQWRLTVHTPYWDWDKEACKSIQMTLPFVDENGHVVHEEPRFKHVSGTENEIVPSLETLPCLILKSKGWERLTATRRVNRQR
jgi:hypothetical protein